MKRYIFQLLQTFFTKSLLLVSFLGRKCEILAKSHHSLRLHQPVKNPISDNSNILWNSPDFSKDYSCLSFKREKIGGHSPTFSGIAHYLRCVKK